MKTSRVPVYPNHELCVADAATSEIHMAHNEGVKNNSLITDIQIKDIFFDTKECCCAKQQKAKSSAISKPNEVTRGVRGVRQNYIYQLNVWVYL